MTFEQFLSGVLSLGLIAIARLVDRWLPPTHPRTAAPTAAQLDIIDDDGA